MVKARSKPQKQRRLAVRLATSCDTLLRLYLSLPLPEGREHCLPLSPRETRHLFRRLAAGVPLERLASPFEQLALQHGGNHPEVIDHWSDITDNEEASAPC